MDNITTTKDVIEEKELLSEELLNAKKNKEIEDHANNEGERKQLGLNPLSEANDALTKIEAVIEEFPITLKERLKNEIQHAPSELFTSKINRIAGGKENFSGLADLATIFMLLKSLVNLLSGDIFEAKKDLIVAVITVVISFLIGLNSKIKIKKALKKYQNYDDSNNLKEYQSHFAYGNLGDCSENEFEKFKDNRESNKKTSLFEAKDQLNELSYWSLPRNVANFVRGVSKIVKKIRESRE